MNVIIAAGCPASGWEMVLPVLAGMGCTAAGEEFADWLDAVLPADSLSDPRMMQEGVRPPAGSGDQANLLLGRHPDDLLLLADSRNLPLLDFWAEKFPRVKFLLFYVHAEPAVARTILQEPDCQKFPDIWQSAGRRMIRFHRRHRQRALLVDARAVMRHPQEFRSVCARIGLQLQPGAAGAPPAARPLERLLAGCWIASRPEMRLLDAELEASAYPLGEPVLFVQPQMRDLADDFRQRLTDMGRQEMERRVEKQRIQCDQAREALLKLQEEHGKTVEENQRLAEQLYQVQEELESVFIREREIQERQQARIHGLQRSLGDQKRDAEELRRRLNGIMKSAAWRISAPIRAAAKPFKRFQREEFRIRAQVRRIKDSGYFDESWYLAQFPDVGKSGLDPVEHYLRFGAAEGRNPAPGFDTAYYAQRYPDVSAAGVNPLVHYIHFGKAEGRETVP